MAPNLRDIARAANVSPATVSRVLNGFQFVSEEVRKRVEDTIREYGYRPNIHARRLNRKDINTFCYVLSNREVLHTIHSRVFMGMVDYYAGQGLHTLFVSAQYSGETRPEDLRLPSVLSDNSLIEGAVLGGINYPNMLQALAARQIPHVVLGNTLDGDPPRESGVVLFDEKAGFERAIAYLAELGHESICFIGDLSTPWGRERYEGYQTGMRNAGLVPMDPLRLAPVARRPRPSGRTAGRPSVDQAASDLIQASMNSVRSIAASRTKLSAIVCANDNVAYGVIEGLKSAGVRVPQDVSVVGFDDSEAAMYCNPALTTCRVPWERLGKTAARMLLPSGHADRIVEKRVVVPVELVVRGSTAAARSLVRRPRPISQGW